MFFKSVAVRKPNTLHPFDELVFYMVQVLCLVLVTRVPRVMNLELMPASLNRAKSDKVTERAKVFAKELYDSKLLSEEGLKQVETGQ
jgi:hypothetical protein